MAMSEDERRCLLALVRVVLQLSDKVPLYSTPSVANLQAWQELRESYHALRRMS
jgi:hypothetical protein